MLVAQPPQMSGMRDDPASPEQVATGLMTDDTYIEYWTAFQYASGSTQKSIRERVYAIRAMLRRTDRTLLTVSRSDLIRDLGRPGIAASTRAGFKSTMHGFFTWMQEEEFRIDNPAVRLPRVRVPKMEANPVTTEDIEHILASGIYRRTRLWVLLYSYQGFRAAEIAAVSAASIDWKRGRILSVNGKAGKEVWRPIHPVVWEQLERWRGADGWLFPSPTREGMHVTAANVSNVLSTAFKRAGLAHRPHQMRAWFATEMIDSGASTVIVAAALRHSDHQTVQKYVRVKDDAISDAMAKLPLVRVPDKSGRQLRSQKTRSPRTAP
ncbi:tyrosine-type recombinase/integrase [Microbacterium sp. NPDC089189]|uniref:tyrosine-type recombinase/integrase n=1 Tax=Microbacterium sp. NPDC089189 TaxID=3154972 RepID=UPI00342A3907